MSILKVPDYLNHFITINSYLAYKNFSVNELTKLTLKLTSQIDNFENTSQQELREVIDEIKITQEQIYHIFSHLIYLSNQVLQINPTLLNKISILMHIIRDNRQKRTTLQIPNVLLEQVNIQLFDLPIIEQTEIALFVHMAYNEKQIKQTSSQFKILNQRLKKLNQDEIIHFNKKIRIK